MTWITNHSQSELFWTIWIRNYSSSHCIVYIFLANYKHKIPRENVHLLTHTDIHAQSKRALPENMCMYKHALMLYKLLRNDLCDNELMHLNFQIADNERSTKMGFFKRQKYDVGKNVLLNRLHILNGKIEKNWINLKLDSYKIKCKELFLLAR